jgi:hypothetical protein
MTTHRPFEDLEMTQPNPRDEAWKMILDQIEALQNKLPKFGCQAAVDHYSTEDGIAGLQGAEFVNSCASRVALDGCEFGEMPDMISLTSSEQGEVIQTHPGEGLASMRDAAGQIFENICEYIYATSGPDAVIDGFDLCLRSQGAIEIDVISEASRPWSPPAVTNSLKQLGAWFDREVERISYEVTDRFTELVTSISADLEDEYPGLDLTVMAGHGSISFKMNYEGQRVRFDRMRFEEVEEAYPGLHEKIEEIENAYNSLDMRIMATDFAPIRVRPEPEPDDSPEP